MKIAAPRLEEEILEVMLNWIRRVSGREVDEETFHEYLERFYQDEEVRLILDQIVSGSESRTDIMRIDQGGGIRKA